MTPIVFWEDYTICNSSLAKAAKQMKQTIAESKSYEHKETSKIILLSTHKNATEGQKAANSVLSGYQEALRKEIISENDKVEYWYMKGGKRRIMELHKYGR